MRISATTLDAFHLYEREVLSEASLLANIYRSSPSSSRMRLGAAYGRVLESPDAHRFAADLFDRTAYRVADYPEFTFPSAMVDPALARIDRAGAFEVKETRRYGAHTVVAKCDHLLGRHLSEFKTRRGAIDAAKYHRSYQWRFMADIFAPERITYRVFRLTVRPMALVETQVFQVYAAERLAIIHRQCCALLERFLRFVRARPGLEAYLPDRVEDRPAPPARPVYVDLMAGPAFEDSPTRPSASGRLKRLREELRDRRVAAAAVVDDVDAIPLFEPIVLPELAAIAELPIPRFTLTAPIPAGARRHQPTLF